MFQRGLESPFLIGIDIGSNGCKASLFDVRGRLVSNDYQEYAKTELPILDPNIFLSYIIGALRNVVKSSKVDPHSIKGIGVGTIVGGFIPIDKKGKQSIVWSDQKISDQIKFIKKNLGVKSIQNYLKI